MTTSFEELMAALTELRAATAPARLMLYYRSPNPGPLRHASISLQADGHCGVEIAGRTLSEALRELSTAHIARKVLMQNVWSSSTTAVDQLLSWDALVRHLHEEANAAGVMASVESSTTAVDQQAAWGQNVRLLMIGVFERYYGSAANAQVDALLRIHGKAADTNFLLDAAETALAKVVSLERARTDLTVLRRNLQALERTAGTAG